MHEKHSCTHAEKPCKTYFIVAMETNLLPSLCLSVLRFSLEFVLAQSVYQLTRTQMNNDWTEETYVMTTFLRLQNCSTFHQSPLILQKTAV